MEDNKNFFLAIGLSMTVLVLWQVFFAMPEAERLKQQQAARQAQIEQTAPPVGTAAGQPGRPATAAGAPARVFQNRQEAVTGAPRVAIDTPRLKGSISLKAARIDDLVLKNYHVSVKPGAENVVLLSPQGAPEPFYAQFDWAGAPGAVIKLPGADTVWVDETKRPLTPSTPVTLSWDNGEGFIFRNLIAVDENYLFTVTQEVENKSAGSVALAPQALIARHKKPKIEGFYIQHEGMIGVLGEKGLQEIDYEEAADASTTFPAEQAGWLGFTDKYWAAVLIPDQTKKYSAGFAVTQAPERPGAYEAAYLLETQTLAPGAKLSTRSHMFAGAKQVSLIDNYKAQLGVVKFEYLIDWGWFHIITKPLFYVLDYFYKMFGNFGVSIIIVTVLIKLIFYPLANKSYASMSQMKKLQPEMMRLRDRYKDDKMRQQQELMALYKKEKVNPLSGCLPILLQIPVFFALYKVLFITIEMRHAPFFGWVQDLSAPDPTSIFNLFGLLPYDPGAVPVLGPFLMLGIWPLLMGATMWVQMKLNPAPTDPVQQQVFAWMPIIFTFMMASFPAGLIIYWTWNNLLSIIQQWVIMERNGVKVDLWDNMGFGNGNGAKLAPAAAPAPAPSPPPSRPHNERRNGKSRPRRK